MKTKIYLKDDLFGKKIFGFSLLIFGAGALFYNNSKVISFGILVILLGCSFISYRGLEINLDKKLVREFVSFLGIKFGSWLDYKNPEYVSVFKMKCTDRQGNKTREIIKINLFYIDNHKLTVYETGDLEEAFKIADFLKSALNINVIDATNSEKNKIIELEKK